MSSATVGASLAPPQRHPYPPQQPARNAAAAAAAAPAPVPAAPAGQGSSSFSENSGPPHPPLSSSAGPAPSTSSTQIMSPHPPTPAVPASTVSTLATTPAPTPATAPYQNNSSSQHFQAPSSSAPMPLASQQSFSISQPMQAPMAAPSSSYHRSFSDVSTRFGYDGPGIYSVRSPMQPTPKPTCAPHCACAKC